MVIGGTGAETFVGSSGVDVFDGGAATDKFTGSGGADTFKFESGDSDLSTYLTADRITDFTTGTDFNRSCGRCARQSDKSECNG